jgi:hypothetical protein
MSIRALAIGGALLLASTVSAAEVNCKFVLKNLALPGRTVESVAETMSISEDEIKKCQEEAKQGGGGDAAGSAEKAEGGDAN